jgi:uncharacterized protein YdeI (YjbR/CyaY-like superfamily)
MQVRPYKKEDRQACIDIFKSNTPLYFADIELPYFEHWLNGQDESQLAYDQTEAEHYYIIEYEDIIIACGGFYLPKAERRANMAWGMVLNNLHKKGIGRQFLEFRISQIQKLYPGYIISLDTSQHSYQFFEKQRQHNHPRPLYKRPPPLRHDPLSQGHRTHPMETYKDKKAFYPKTRKAWRQWLEKNHQKEPSIWLILYNKDIGIPSITWSEAVEEALCFGWIDSVVNKRDEESRYQFFTTRKPKSNWSRINKEKIAQLTDAGLMAPAGLAVVATAKENGTWSALDEVEATTVPPDLQKALKTGKKALTHWEAFPRSSKKIILHWILSAKRPETRQKRISETVTLAEINKRANHPA